MTEHHVALKSLKREHEKLKEKEKILADILSALRGGYNPNYQDMAVLEAVRGWEEYAGLSHGDAQNEEGDDNAENSEEEKEEEEEVLDDGMWSAGRLDYDLDRLINVDHVNLLLEHDKHIGDETTKSVCTSNLLFACIFCMLILSSVRPLVVSSRCVASSI